MSPSPSPSPSPGASKPACGRRTFIVSGSAAAIALSFAALGRARQAIAATPWGELIVDPDGLLDLPAGFTYELLETQGDEMDDGYRVPGQPDGMACFEGEPGTFVLMRNHELNVGSSASPYHTGQLAPAQAYQPDAMGGVTRVVVDAATFERISSNLVLVGTVRNCAGGPSPWGWLSCEETTAINGTGPSTFRHGYVFLCRIDADSVQPPDRIDAYGRFNHEAACVDPSNNYAYLTEDRGDSCLYRFVPDTMDEPFVGTLQALAIVGVDNYETSGMQPNELLAVEWMNIDDPDPDTDTVRTQAHARGAASFVRAEGICFYAGQVYVCSTSGGPAGEGQIFRLIDGDSPTLELVVRSTDNTVLDNPDNITVAPWGDLFIAEDGGPAQYIRWVDANGQVCDFARNAGSNSEFAGVCFSPDGRAMFVNLQHDGITLVVTGPFPGAVPGEDSGGESGGESGSDSDSTGDEGGDTSGDTSTDGDAGFEADTSCNCSTTAGAPPGPAAALSVAAAIGLRGLLTQP